MRNKMAEKARELAAKFPTHSSRGIAAMLEMEFPGRNKDAYRDAVRYNRGEKTGRGKYKVSVPIPRINLPEGTKRDYTPMELPDGSVIGILSDIHIPHHDSPALECAIDWLVDQEPGVILLNGDILDCYQVSSFDRDPASDSMTDEILKGRMFLAGLRKVFPKARIIWREGNHEYRLKRFLMSHAPVLLGVADFEIPHLLRFAEHRVEWLADKRIIKAGKLAILHGHELSNGLTAPVNPARGLWMKFKDSAIMGHCHQTSEHTEKTGNGKLMGCWTVASLCDLNPPYRPINNFGHGCALVTIYKGGDFHVENKKIIGGKMA